MGGLSNDERDQPRAGGPHFSPPSSVSGSSLHNRLWMLPTLIVVGLHATSSFSQYDVHLTLQDALGLAGIGDNALSPDGKTFALTRDEQIVLLPSEGGWPVTLTTTSGGKSDLAWSADGRELAYASQGSIWVVAASGGEPRRLTNGSAGSGDPRRASDRKPLWSPKGRWILFESGRRGTDGLAVVSSHGESTNVLTGPHEEASDARWSPSGDQIVYVARNQQYFSGRLQLIRFDSASGQSLGEPKTLYTAPVDRGGGWAIRGAEWSADGQQLVTVLQNSGWDHLYLLSPQDGVPKQITDGPFEDEDPQFSPDGKNISFVSSRGLLEARNLFVVPAARRVRLRSLISRGQPRTHSGPRIPRRSTLNISRRSRRRILLSQTLQQLRHRDF
jgi:Tol biopolymer transport system component